jgi:thiamine-monophosphate kinase
MAPQKVKSLTENQLLSKVQRVFSARGKQRLRWKLDDDVALFSPSAGKDLILTCDWFLEGSHFLRRKHAADSVGWKCLARAVSDIAATGGSPKCFLLSLALPPSAAGQWLDQFLSGLRRASKELHCSLAGGDTTRRREILISVTVIGEVASGRAIRRDGAHPGDHLFVTGRLGEAELGLRMLRTDRGAARAKNASLRKHLYPEPRLQIGEWLAKNRLASALMDLSDGLSSDLPRLCSASGVGARVDANRLPVTSLVERRKAVHLALHGGDDYELLFTVRKDKATRIPSAFHGIAITRIGEITAGKKILVHDGNGTRELNAEGWDPFRVSRPLRSEIPQAR